jgi:predicted ATPase
MIEYIKIEGYKSIKSIELELEPINVFIGSNGAGKSNFVSFYRMIHAIFNRQLQKYVIEHKADRLLYFGRKRTENMYGKMIFSDDNAANNAYWFNLQQTEEGGLYIDKEGSGYNVSRDNDTDNYIVNSNLEESKIAKETTMQHVDLSKHLSNVQIYHFHDTSSTSMLRQECNLDDNRYLKSDGRNLPAFLYKLKQEYPKKFRRLLKTIQSIAPYIHDFILEPKGKNKDEIALNWIETTDIDSFFTAYQFSDGTLRFIALATVLLQADPPKVIVIDEPELGLHPQAVTKLSGLIKSISLKTQVIISTQSVNLVACFSPKDLITVDRDIEEKQSTFKRLDSEKLQHWLEDHTLGELWERNIINSAQPFIK